jgi:hypothetical protein
MNKKDTIVLIQTILEEHEHYWKDKRVELEKYKNAYEGKFWQENDIDKTMIRVETADCYAYVESYQSSLFTKNPAVVITPDESNPAGDSALSQAVANRWLFDQRTPIEIASRIGLIYPQGFVKMSPKNSDDMLNRVETRAVSPWEVIVDQDASSWDSQRFVGHIYYIPLNEAKEKWGNKEWNPQPKDDYFSVQNKVLKTDDLPDSYQYIKIVELYDLSYDFLYVWTPNLMGERQLIEKTQIPLRTYDEQPLAPIVPLYYSRRPEKPLCGISAVSRVYDQFYEKNILRTYWANAVRRDSRQYLYKEGAIDEESLAKITSGVDGAMIPIDEPTLAGVIQQVGVEPISSNFDRYLAQIESDINRGTILAPFSRGETSGVTATEISALAQYSASQLGKLARERDLMIERLALVYLRSISLLAEEGEKATISIDGKPKIITVADLDAKFKIIALDQASTPVSSEIKKRTLVELFPVLTQLGVQPAKIKEEIIRLYDLPESFLEEAPQETLPPTPTEPGLEAGAGAPSKEQMIQMMGGM